MMCVSFRCHDPHVTSLAFLTTILPLVSQSLTHTCSCYNLHVFCKKEQQCNDDRYREYVFCYLVKGHQAVMTTYLRSGRFVQWSPMSFGDLSWSSEILALYNSAKTPRILLNNTLTISGSQKKGSGMLHSIPALSFVSDFCEPTV